MESAAIEAASTIAVLAVIVALAALIELAHRHHDRRTHRHDPLGYDDVVAMIDDEQVAR